MWEWINPFLDDSVIGPTRQVFRAHHYMPTFDGLAGRELDPTAHSAQNTALALAR